MGIANLTSTIYDDDGTAIVLPLRRSLRSGTSKLVCLEAPAAKVWQLLEHGATLGEAIRQIAAHHRIPEERLRDDLQPVLETLREQGIWETTT